MKRVLLSIGGTVVGIVALLSYKTHGTTHVAVAGLPSAGLPQPSTTGPGAPSGPGSPASSSSTAPTGSPAPTSSTAPTAGSSTFTGVAESTRYGVVQVKITVAAKKITDVAFVQLTAFDGRSQRINADAAPILLQETLSAQSAQIDSVSGASYTSQGYEQSLQSALDQAGLP